MSKWGAKNVSQKSSVSLSGKEEVARKHEFARLLLSGKNGFESALAICGGDIQDAMAIGTQWSKDPIVLSEIERLKEEVHEEDFMPSKTDYCKLIMDEIKSAKTEDGKVKLLRLYGEVRGFIDKPNSNQGGTNVTQNRVMVVNNFGSDDDWEKKARLQQAKMIDVTQS